MSPRRTRSGKLLSSEPEEVSAPGSVARTSSVGPRPKAMRTRGRRARQIIENENIVEDVVDTATVIEGNVDEELIVEGNEPLDRRPNEYQLEVGSSPAEDGDGDAIEIVNETADNARIVIDLTDDTSEMRSPLRLGADWASTPSFLSRMPPNPWVTPRPTQPPIMVDLTDSPANPDTPRQNTTASDSPSGSGSGGVGISVQCPVCLESLRSIKRSGADVVSTVCGHIFCSRCLPASLRTSGRCPSCRRKIGAGEYHKLFI
eukprot:GFUD01049251.1.p1 GENE.GFUD01049251.1~~GFUD01049251.1.p1  ORF type:complete len:260 (+),score=80.43 GFUD01049251.1:156-935(+)